MPTTPPQHSRLSLARRLRLQQLAVFEKVVEAGSILAASNELAMTQPAVSKSIQELEAQLGGALFGRGQRVAEALRGREIGDLQHDAEDLQRLAHSSSLILCLRR